LDEIKNFSDEMSENEAVAEKHLESYEAYLKKSISDFLKSLLTMASVEKDQKSRARINKLIESIRKIPELKIELDAQERGNLLRLYDQKISYTGKEIKFLEDSGKYMLKILDQIKEEKLKLTNPENTLRKGESFFWYSGKDSSRTNRDRVTSSKEILDNLHHLISSLKIEKLHKYLIKDQPIDLLLEKSTEALKRIKELSQEFGKISGLEKKHELSQEERGFLKQEGAANRYNDDIMHLSALINDLVNQAYISIQNMDASISAREYALKELEGFREIIEKTEVMKKSKRIQFNNVLNRSLIKAKTMYRLSLRKNAMNVLMLGIPTALRCGVVSSFKKLSEELDRRGLNVFILTHWWHKYFFFDKENGRYDRILTYQQVGNGNGNYELENGSYKKVGNKAGSYELKETRYEKVKEQDKQGSYTKVNMSPYNLLDANCNNVVTELPSYTGFSIIRYLKDFFNFNPQIIHVHTHTFEFDKSFDRIIAADSYPDAKIVFTLHAFIPYQKVGRELGDKMLQNTITEQERQNIRSNFYRGREKSQETMMLKSDAIVTISKAHKAALESLYPELQGKVVAIINGTDFHRFADDKVVAGKARHLRESLGIAENAKVIAYLGRVERQKRVDILIDLFDRIAAKFPDAVLLMVGSDKSELDGLVSNYGLRPELMTNVKFTGWVDAGKDASLLASYMRTADVLVQPGRTKNHYSMAAIQAAALKIPVISCPGELSMNESSAPEEQGNALLKLLENPDEFKPKCEEIYLKVKEEYNEEIFVQKHIQLYKQLVGPGIKPKPGYA